MDHGRYGLKPIFVPFHFHSFALGLLYYFLTHYVQMTPETRETIKKLDVLFEEQNVATRLGGVIRGFMFNMPPRVLYNYVTNPIDTIEEFRNVTVKEVVDRTLSDGFRRRFILIFWVQYVSKLVGWSSLYYYSTLTREDRANRAKRSIELCDLKNSI